MGSGEARELGGSDEPERVLDPELAARLTAALDRLDKFSPSFKSTRDEERLLQTTKLWGRTCKGIDADLRDLAKVLINSHQLSLDIGSDGGGFSTRPFVEEIGGGKLGRLAFKIDESGSVTAVAGDREIARIPLADLTYAFLERSVVEWAVSAAEARK